MLSVAGFFCFCLSCKISLQSTIEANSIKNPLTQSVVEFSLSISLASMIAYSVTAPHTHTHTNIHTHIQHACTHTHTRTSTILTKRRSMQNQSTQCTRKKSRGLTPNTWYAQRLPTMPRQMDSVMGSNSPGQGIMVARRRPHLKKSSQK